MTKADNKNHLSQNKFNAIEFLLSGDSDSEIAEKINVSRQTVNDWKNHDAEFIAEVNRRRQSIWEASKMKTINLYIAALESLQTLLESENENIRFKAASEVARLYGPQKSDLVPPREINAPMVSRKQEIERAQYLRDNWNIELGLLEYMNPEMHAAPLESES